jgi:hypothetical protein
MRAWVNKKIYVYRNSFRIMKFLISHFDFIVKFFSLIRGFCLFLKDVIEYSNCNKIRKAEFLEKLIAGFDSPSMVMAIRILDGYYYRSNDPKDIEVESEQEGKMNLHKILKNHKVIPVTSPFEVEVRDSFCSLLDYFSKLNYYLSNNLINLFVTVENF